MGKDKHSKIIEIMQYKNIISIKELASELGCTEMTVRRNLDQLQSMNFVKREHGYATLLNQAQSTDYYTELEENTAQKRAIAAVALSFIKPEQNICLDSGTTVQQLVNILPDNMPLSVVTPSLLAALTLTGHDKIQVYIPGGFLHHRNRSLLFNEFESLNKCKVDIAFLSCRSLRIPEGAFEHTQLLTATKRALASIADKKILLIDYSKWNVNSICNSILLKDIDIIITDDQAPKDEIDKLVVMGKEIIVVETETMMVDQHFNKNI